MAAPRVTSTCIMCRNSMPAGSSYCAKCDNYQDWRRHLYNWSAIVGGGLGIIAVIAGVAPVWGIASALWALAYPPKSNVSLSPLQCSSQTVQFIATNAGGKPAYLYDPHLSVARGTQNFPLMVSLAEPDRSEVPANGILAQTLALETGRQLPRVPAGEVCVIGLDISAVDPDGSVRLMQGSCPCPIAAN
jgi:hypothetical protein